MPVGDRPTVRAVMAPAAPKIDGVLDEEAWSTAEVVDQFVQQEPNEGQPASDRTEVRILYDRGHLYIGIRAFASAPVSATEMRRDADRLFDEDNFQVILDTFHDSRNGYMFVTTPLGAKLEQQIFDEGENVGRGGTTSNVNRNWDGVWNAAARIVDDGWTAEMDIPFSTVRFVPRDDQVWGINFQRHVRRKNETVLWSPLPKAFALTRVSMAGELHGLSDISRGLDLRLKPFFVGGGHDVQLTADGGVTDYIHDVGLDARYGLTSGLNMDVTINTDFAQVEVDEQQVNLTRYSLFYPEKRDFFLENSNFFTMGTSGVFSQTQVQTDLFFSRRIGLSQAGTPIPIQGGVRVAGKSGRNNIGVLDIQTDDYFSRPGDNFFVGRYSRDVPALAGRRPVRQQGQRQRQRAFQPHVWCRREPRPQRQPADPDLRRQDRDARHGGQGHVLLRPHRLSRSEMEPVPELPRRAGEFQRRGRLRAAHRHPHHQGPLRPDAAAEERQRQAVRTDVRADQHHRSVEPAGLPAAPRDAGHHAARRHVHQRVLPEHARRARRAVPHPADSGRFRPAPTRCTSWYFTVNSSPGRRIYERVTVSPVQFYGGTRLNLSAAAGLRATSQFSAEVQYNRNDVKMPWGDFVVDLSTLRLDYTFTPRMTVRSLTQDNTSTHEISNNVRFNFIYRPGSDIYIVYNDLSQTGLPADIFGKKDRQLVVKATYLLQR